MYKRTTKLLWIKRHVIVFDSDGKLSEWINGEDSTGVKWGTVYHPVIRRTVLVLQDRTSACHRENYSQ
jgi:hypothetical protein